MDPFNHSHNEQLAMTTLSCVQQNDHTLMEFLAGYFGGFIYEETGNCWPNDSVDLVKLGIAIGANTNLQNLDIRNACTSTHMTATNSALF